MYSNVLPDIQLSTCVQVKTIPDAMSIGTYIFQFRFIADAEFIQIHGPFCPKRGYYSPIRRQSHIHITYDILASIRSFCS